MNEDPYQAKQYWTELVRSAADRGALDRVPTRAAITKKDHRQAREQSIAISRRNYQIAPDAWEQIFGGSNV